MMYILIPLLIVLMGLAVWSLLRGIIVFLRTTREGLERGDAGIKDMQLLQNKMMFNRIKFQGLAIVVVVVMLAASHTK
ncbi:HIG1 domain-containing protein [Novosphingobium sp. FKTRR1]|uniref:HIG1 domain-containing protein n=1 Tax=unclassified Novosphingobium TaxID=2644732 RepID=UPI001CF06485|nr:HIG1 domain-containing protein [Novosphingobium sp. FKTRR1]